jgi:hypothetical protein
MSESSGGASERTQAALAAHKRRVGVELLVLGLAGLLGLRIATAGFLPRGFGLALVAGTALLAARAVRVYSAKRVQLSPPASNETSRARTPSSTTLVLVYLGVLICVGLFIHLMGVLFAPNAR